jgi:PST family polysaccharide transporter
MIAKFCGAWQLGIYTLAYNLLLFPVYQVQGILGPVMFPFLSSLQTSKRDLKEAYVHACEAVALLMFPLMAGLAVVADDFVGALYGPRWAEAIPVIRVLAIAGIGNSVGTTTGWIYTSTARTDLMFKWSLASAPVLLAAFAAGVRWGALGVAVAYTAALYGLLWYPLWRFAGGVIALDFKEAMRMLSGPFAAASFMAVTVAGARLLMPARPLPRLVVSVLIGVGVYWAAVQVLDLRAYASLKERLFQGRMAKQHAAT